MKHINNEVIYEIYPLTFNYAPGSKSDPYHGAYGNLKGITAYVDYVASLGVDAIWITPFYPWGGHGFGYDITDYCSIAPMYGDFDDFKELCDVYHGKGMKVIIDQVYNHCSIRHEWFKKSVERIAPYEDFFVWADAERRGDKLFPPNNWQAIWNSLGDSAWTWHPTREQYYLHSFDWALPNLNLNNPAVQDAILEVAKFWFGLGVDGFRLDAVTHYACDEQLRSNPTYHDGWQNRLYDINSPNGALFINRLKDVCDSYDTPKTLLAEYWYEKSPEGLEKARKLFNTMRCDAFFTGALNGNLDSFKGNIQDDLHISPLGEKLNWALSNHDLERVVSRVFGHGCKPEKAELLMDMMLSLPGSVCIFQGEELGLPNPQTIERCKNHANDPLHIWKPYINPWDAGRAGFAMSDEHDDPSRFLALRPAPIHYRYAVNRQKEETSMLNSTRRMIKERKEGDFNGYGHVHFIEHGCGNNVYAFVRTNEDETVRCLYLYNFGDNWVFFRYHHSEFNLAPASVIKKRLW